MDTATAHADTAAADVCVHVPGLVLHASCLQGRRINSEQDVKQITRQITAAAQEFVNLVARPELSP